jgi:hypothetical protein
MQSAAPQLQQSLPFIRDNATNSFQSLQEEAFSVSRMGESKCCQFKNPTKASQPHGKQGAVHSLSFISGDQTETLGTHEDSYNKKVPQIQPQLTSVVPCCKLEATQLTKSLSELSHQSRFSDSLREDRPIAD